MEAAKYLLRDGQYADDLRAARRSAAMVREGNDCSGASGTGQPGGRYNIQQCRHCVREPRGQIDELLRWQMKALSIKEQLAPGSVSLAQTYGSIGIGSESRGQLDGGAAGAR